MKNLKKLADIDNYDLLILKEIDLKELYSFSLNAKNYEECNILEIEVFK